MLERISQVKESRPYRFVRRHFSSLLKISVSVIGLALVLTRIPAGQIRDELVIVSWPWLAVTFFLVTASLFLRAYRWMLLLNGLNANIRYGRLVELYFVGNFFNAFSVPLPKSPSTNNLFSLSALFKSCCNAITSKLFLPLLNVLYIIV